jgi:hypothetical protein
MDNARLKVYLWFLLAGALFVAVLANVVIAASPSSRFCGLCHGPAYQDWQASAHQDIGCNRCHQQPGALGQGIQRLRVFSMIGSMVVGSKESPGNVSRDVCLSCHRAITETVVSKNNLIMSHKEVMETPWNCGSCHRQAVHKAGVRPDLGTMDRCLACHNEQGADTECEVCHVTDARLRNVSANTPWRVAHGPDWRSNHGLLDLNLCQNCHTSKYCSRCHEIEDLPHSSGWLDTHGKTAKDEKQRAACYVCHDKEKVCAACHVQPMPHPDNWLGQHLEVAKAEGTKTCDRCHMARGCDDCHAKHVHGVSVGKLRENFLKQGRSWGGFGSD